MNTYSHPTVARLQRMIGLLLIATLALAGFGIALPHTAPAQAVQSAFTAQTNVHLRDVKAVTAGYNHTCALLNTGKVKCWGKNDFGQLGNGTTDDSIYPVEVTDINNATQITAGSDFTCIINDVGNVKCWGDNTDGQLGANTSAAFSSLPLLIDFAPNDAVRLDAGDDHVCVTLADVANSKCWGSNRVYQLGESFLGDFVNHPIEISWGPKPEHVFGVGGNFSCFSSLTDKIRVVCWGENTNGQLARGYKGDYAGWCFARGCVVDNLPNLVGLELGSEHACALQFVLVYVVSCWGDNDSGEIGIGTVSDMVTSPTTITGFRTAPTSISAGGYFTCAILSDDTVQCWGWNGAGRLGNGTFVNANVPTDVSGLTGVVQLNAGNNHTCAVLDTSEVKCWGVNNDAGVNGLLGTGDIDSLHLATPDYVIEGSLMSGESPIDLGDVLPDVPTSDPPFEYGDAPDQIPTTGANIEAYPGTGVNGHFPTLDGTNAKGPKHVNPRLHFLGDTTTSDAPVDFDGVPNIDTTNLVANLDGADDGWLNRDDITRFDNCQTVTLRVRLRRSALAIADVPLYLNAWFDGNRDGDWKDTRPCETGDTAYEWMLQNHKILAKPLRGDFVDVNVTTQRVLVNSSVNPAWVRITLSDRTAITPTTPAGALPDGRGPDTGTFDYGETEDYLWDPVTDREKYGTWAITKTVTSSGAITVGSNFNYVVEVSRNGGSITNVVGAMVDVLPPQTSFVSGVVFNELSPTVFPVSAVYEPGFSGPNGRVRWTGAMSDGGRFRARFTVRVNECPTTPVTNTAVLFLPGSGKVLSSTQTTNFTCTPSVPPTFALNKQIVSAVGSPAPPASTQLSETVYLLTLSHTNVVTNMVAAIEDDLPTGLFAVEISASRGAVTTTNANRTVRWLGFVGPTLAPPQVWVRAHVIGLAQCGSNLSNIAKWAVRTVDGSLLQGQSNASVFTPGCVLPPTPTLQPTWTPVPTYTPTRRPTNTPVPIATNTSVPLPTDAPPDSPTYTPVPRATNTSVPLPTNTPVPLPTDAPPGAPTYTPVPLEPANKMPVQIALPIVSR